MKAFNLSDIALTKYLFFTGKGGDNFKKLNKDFIEEEGK